MRARGTDGCHPQILNLRLEELIVKKKLLVLVAMLLCVVTVFASCASSMKMGKVVGDGTYNDENPSLTATAKVDLKGSKEDAAGDLIVYKDVNPETSLSTYTVYNLATNATVWTGTESKTESGENSTRVSYHIELMEQWGTTLVSVSTATVTVTADDSDYKYDYKLLTATGAEIVTITEANKKAIAEPWFIEDLFCVDGKVYRIADDGTVAAAFDWSDLRGEPDEDLEKVGEVYIVEQSNGIVVYDASLNLVGTYYLPSYEVDGEIFALSNGNLFIQYAVVQDIMAEDYDYLDGMAKYNLYSFLLNAENGKLKEVKADFVVEDVLAYDANDEDWYFNEKIENVAWVIYIEDQRINERDVAIKMVSLTNKGKVAGVIDNIIPNMSPEGLKHVADNRWIVENMVGQSFLINEKGDVLGEVTGLDEDEMTAKFFVLNNKIYDWDLNVKVNLVEEKCYGEYVVMNHSVLFATEDDEIKIYANGEVKTLINKTVAEEGKRELEMVNDAPLFVIVDTATEGKTKYEIYNDVGTLLITIDNAVIDLNSCVIAKAESNNAILIAGMTIPADGEEAKVVYYRVA